MAGKKAAESNADQILDDEEDAARQMKNGKMVEAMSAAVSVEKMEDEMKMVAQMMN